MFDTQALVLVSLVVWLIGTACGFLACSILCTGTRPPPKRKRDDYDDL